MMLRMLIGGELIAGQDRLDVIDPATGEVFATAPRADPVLLDYAIAKASSAFPAWANAGFAARRHAIVALADAVEARTEEFAHLLTREQGRPLGGARFEIAQAVGLLRHFAALEPQDEVLLQTEKQKIIRHRSALGVVAAIAPWNFPLLLLVLKLAPGLMAGNCMIAKPAPTTPLTTLLLGEVAAPILPAGVLSTIVDANDLGPLLSAHPDIAKVSFTGSTPTGKRVMEAAAGTMKRLTLELGGNDAAIVLNDVDVGQVAPQIFAAATVNAGQVCLAAKRIYAHRAIFAPLREALVELAQQTVVGNGMEQGTQMGPLQNSQQWEKAKELLDDAKSRGGEITAGSAPDGPGYFIAPTVVTGLDDDAPLVREEQFAPLIPILPFDSEDDVVQRANASPYGLGGTIWTADAERGLALARRLNTGVVWINHHLDAPFDVPLGGAKQSGFGVEYGIEGLYEYMQDTIINIAL